MCGPIFLLVYTLESLGVALAMMDSGRRGKEACTMAFFGLLMTISSMWDLRAPRLLHAPAARERRSRPGSDSPSR